MCSVLCETQQINHNLLQSVDSMNLSPGEEVRWWIARGEHGRFKLSRAQSIASHSHNTLTMQAEVLLCK